MTQIAIGFVAIGLGCLDQRVKAGTGGSSGGSVYELPVVAADYERPDGILDALSKALDKASYPQESVILRIQEILNQATK